MFHLRDDAEPYRIVGIDPGTSTLGIAVIDVDLITAQLTVRDARTMHASRLSQYRKSYSEVYGDRFARLSGLEEALVDYFVQRAPHAIISESPYLGRHAATYAALTECMTTICRAVCRYSDRIPLVTVDPARAKARLKVSGKSGDKELMRQAILGLTDLQNPDRLDLTVRDEHSIDALAIAYYHACTVRTSLVL